MKRLGKSNTEEETDIDITPMLDVVFIMLIFFIVTASFVKESGIDINTRRRLMILPIPTRQSLLLLKSISLTRFVLTETSLIFELSSQL